MDHLMTIEVRALCGILLCILFLFCTSAEAQEEGNPRNRSSIAGIVLDQNSASVSGAEIVLTDGSQIIARTVTNDYGEFRFDNVPARATTIQARARGFDPFTQSIAALNADSLTHLKIVLAPASLSEQLTITASRTAIRVEDTPSSVVLINDQDLSSTASITIDDALRQVPGFTLFRRSGSRTANPTSQGLSLRGVGASGASRALVLVDGVPINDPFGGWIYWGQISRTTVSRIEVVRGASSDLYGSAALGGVVQIITENARERHAQLEVSYGNQRTPDAALFLSTFIGKEKRWSASLAFETFRTDGYITVAPDERGRVDVRADSRRAAFSATLAHDFSNQTRAFLRASFYGEARVNGTPLQRNRTHLRQFVFGMDNARLPHSLGAFALRFYGGTEVFDQTFTAVSADRNSESLTRLQRVPAQFTGFTSQWSRDIFKTQKLIAGADARWVRGASDEIAYVMDRPTSLIGAGGRERSLGFFLTDIIALTPRLLLNVGARLDRWHNYDAWQVTRTLTQPRPSAINTFPDRVETAFSPRLSLLFKPQEKLSLTASIARAFRAPTLNELYRAFRVGDVLTLANENLRAERLTGGEMGARLALFDNRITVRSNLFWSEITRAVSNVTLSVTPNLITRQRQNIGRTRSRGVEIDAEARLARNWTLSGGYLFVDATVRSFPANTALENSRLPQVARHQLTFQLRYAHTSHGTFSLQGRASGSQFDDDQNRFRLDKYFTLDAFASYRIAQGVEIFVAAENLFNTRYEIGRTPVTTIGPPRFVRIGVRLQFGAR